MISFVTMTAGAVLLLANTTREGPTRRVADARGRFSLEVGAACQSMEDPVLGKLGGFALRCEPPAPAATLKAVAVDFPLPISLDDYVKNSTAAWERIWKIEERSETMLGGKRALRLVILQTTGADTKRLLKYFVASHQGGATVITLYAEPEAFAGRLVELEAIARSFQPGR